MVERHGGRYQSAPPFRVCLSVFFSGRANIVTAHQRQLEWCTYPAAARVVAVRRHSAYLLLMPLREVFDRIGCRRHMLIEQRQR